MADVDLVARTRDEIRARLAELEPLVAERDRLQRALEALEAIAPERRARRAGARRGTGRGRERAGRGERRRELLALVEANPGITPSNAAELIGVSSAQVHSLARRLEQGGELERRDGGLFTRTDGAAAGEATAGASTA